MCCVCFVCLFAEDYERLSGGWHYVLFLCDCVMSHGVRLMRRILLCRSVALN